MKQSLSIALLVLVAFARIQAHEVRPAFLELTERADGQFDVLWKVPALGGVPLGGEDLLHEAPKMDTALPGSPKTMPCGCPAPTAPQLGRSVLAIHPSLPKDAKILAPPQIERLAGAELRRWTIGMGMKGLDGWQVGVHGLEATMVDVLVRIAFADGRVVTRMLRPDAPSFVFHSHDAGPAAAGYFSLGVKHILLGVDHLLFVLCLLFLVRGVGPILKTITAFTIAHSITLGLATLRYVHVPPGPVEATIALSIVFLATEIARRRTGQQSITEQKPWLIAFAFGLLHGFGFAGALSEVGLPANDIPMALLFFNVGVEAGQLLFVAAVLPLLAASRRFMAFPISWIRSLPAYGIGAVASCWLIARIAAFW